MLDARLFVIFVFKTKPGTGVGEAVYVAGHAILALKRAFQTAVASRSGPDNRSRTRRG